MGVTAEGMASDDLGQVVRGHTYVMNSEPSPAIRISTGTAPVAPVVLSSTPLAHWVRVASVYLGLIAALTHVTLAILALAGVVSHMPSLFVSGLFMLAGALMLVATFPRHRVETCLHCHARPTLGWAGYCSAIHTVWHTRWFSMLLLVLAGATMWGTAQLVAGEQAVAHLWFGGASVVIFVAFLAGDYHARARAWCERCSPSEQTRGLLARAQAQRWAHQGTPRASLLNRADYY